MNAGRPVCYDPVVTQAFAVARFEPTGRLAGRNPENHTRVRHWSRWRTRNELLADATAQEFRERLDSAAYVDTDLLCYRGRSSNSPLAPLDMGPPPRFEWPSASRYALRDRSVLYMCLSEDGVRREVDTMAGEVVYVQRFLVPRTVRLADFRNLDEGDLLNDAFWFAEIAQVEPALHSNMEFTQVLAELVSVQFDGMVVPGVRGEKGSLYANVVIFASGLWPTWLDPKSTPSVLSRSQREF